MEQDLSWWWLVEVDLWLIYGWFGGWWRFVVGGWFMEVDGGGWWLLVS